MKKKTEIKKVAKKPSVKKTKTVQAGGNMEAHHHNEWCEIHTKGTCSCGAG